MSRAKKSRETLECPVGCLFLEIRKVFSPSADIVGHFDRSRLELLKAVSAFIDERIRELEKKQRPARKKRVTPIKVEE